MMKRYIESNYGTDYILSIAKAYENAAKDIIRTNRSNKVEKFIKLMKANIGTSISSIKDWFISMSMSISSTASRVAGAITAAFANIGTAISSAIASTKAYIVALFQKTSAILATPIAGITYGKLIAIAVVSSAVIFVMYKIYKAIKKRNSDPMSEVAATKSDLHRIKKSINESITFFGNMNYILREDASEDANGVTGSASMSLIAKASGLALEMFKWITKGTVNGVKKVVSLPGSILKNHPYFSAIVCFATCAIFAVMNSPILSSNVLGTINGIRAGLA